VEGGFLYFLFLRHSEENCTARPGETVVSDAPDEFHLRGTDFGLAKEDRVGLGETHELLEEPAAAFFVPHADDFVFVVAGDGTPAGGNELRPVKDEALVIKW